MRTNGLVWAVALSLSLTGRVGFAAPAEGSNSSDAAPPASTEFENQENYDSGVTYYAAPSEPGFLYAGAELSILHVDARPGSSTSFTFDNTANPGTDFAISQDSEFTNWGYAPRAWIGAHLTENWSVEGRFWHLQDSQSSLVTPTSLGVPIPPGSFNVFFSNSSIEAYTVDIDAIRTFNVGNWQIDALLGARHGSFSAENVFAGSSGTGLAISSDQIENFNGTGFSYGGRIKHSIGGSNLFWVTSARGSYLSGDQRLVRPLVITTPLGTTGTAPPREDDAKLTIAEFQTGVEWDYALTLIPATAFVRASYEFQDWQVNGHHDNFVGSATNGNNSSSFNISQGLGEMTLNGVTLAAGIGW